MNLIWVSSDLSYAWFHILVILFELWVLFGQLDLWFLQWEKCLVLGSYRAVTSPSNRRGSEARLMLLTSRVKRWGFHHWFEIIPLHHVILLKALLCSYGLNTLDACWIAVDVWSNSSRCRKYRSTCFGRDAYRYNHCHRYRHDFARFYQLLDSNLFTHRLLAFMREATSKHYGPRVYSHPSFTSPLLLCFVTLLLWVLTWQTIYKGLTTPW